MFVPMRLYLKLSQVSDHLACAGQPHQGQLASIAADGYQGW